MSTYSVMNHIHHTSRYRLYVRLIRSVLCTAGIYYAPSYASLFLLLFSLTCYRTLLTSVQFSKSLFSECFFFRCASNVKKCSCLCVYRNV